MTKTFEKVAMSEDHPHWEKMTKRYRDLKDLPDEIRSPFARDYTRILHSTAYRRLKHKTQVFFNIDNDHICTRIEHVAHVCSVSNTIARELGLNVELTNAIALGHDLGHAPFGHEGEEIITGLMEKAHIEGNFWHERNGLYFADHFELLRDKDDRLRNLCLTYAVRDGIVSHCGEVDQNGIKPRDNLCDLYGLKKGEFNPGTWEACVVKIADKIAYLGRDIEDAKNLHFLSDDDLKELNEITGGIVNTTNIIGEMVRDICQNSTPEDGICLSGTNEKKLNAIKRFNRDRIYANPKLEPFRHYAKLVLDEIFSFLKEAFDVNNECVNWKYLDDRRISQRLLVKYFIQWLTTYTTSGLVEKELIKKLDFVDYDKNMNEKVYTALNTSEQYDKAILDFISGMTDRFAIEAFGELIKY